MKRTAAATSLRDRNSSDIEELYLAVPEALGALPPVIREVALLFDGVRRPAEVATAAQISAAQCSGIIKKLTELGVLRRPRVRHITTQPHGHFSPVEEAFFAADVPPIDECNEPFESVGDRIRAVVCEVIVRLQGQRSLL